MARELHEVWLEGKEEEATIHIGTPKQIQNMMSKGEIANSSERLLQLPDTTFEEAEEQARIVMQDLGLGEDDRE